MSSLINKSGIIVAPKGGAARRRPRPPPPPLDQGNAPASPRPNVDESDESGRQARAQRVSSSSHRPESSAIQEPVDSTVSSIAQKSPARLPLAPTTQSPQQSPPSPTPSAPERQAHPPQDETSQSLSAHASHVSPAPPTQLSQPSLGQAYQPASAPAPQAPNTEQSQPPAATIADTTQVEDSDVGPVRSGGGWTVITPDHISNSVNRPQISKRKRPLSKGKGKERAPSPIDSISDATILQPVVPTTVTAQPPIPAPSTDRHLPISARLANAQRRRRRAFELANSIHQSIEVESARPPSTIIPHSSSRSSDGDDSDGSFVDDSSNQKESAPPSRTRQRKKRVRATTPPGAEIVTIVPSMVTMHELAARTRRTGMLSDREKKMRQINWVEVEKQWKKQRIERAERPQLLQEEANKNLQARSATPEDADPDAELQAMGTRSGHNRPTGVQIIQTADGGHMIDEQSQRFNFHQAAQQNEGALEELEESDLTSKFNSHTHLLMNRREKEDRLQQAARWSAEETDSFYDCLSKFGTDFMIISKLFPNRTRRQIKAKFNREQRLDIGRVNGALSKKAGGKWDLDHFMGGAGFNEEDFGDPRELEEELKKEREEKEKEIEVQRALAETTRSNMKAGGYLSDDELDKKKKRSKKKTPKLDSSQYVNDSELEEIVEGDD